MKKIFTLLIGIVFSITVLKAQVVAPPQAFSYRATFMKANGNAPLSNKTIGLRINILTTGGASVYEEIFKPTTNKDGQIDIVIGRGGIGFSSIEWSTGEFFLKTEVDVNGGTNYQPLSETQLLSVPYALYAGKAGSAVNESDPIFSLHPAHGITSGNITDWKTAYGWGNHAGLYRPIDYVPAWSEIANKPTTIIEFGITDAVTTMGDQTIAGNKTFTGTTTVSNALNAGNGFGSIYSETEKRPILGQRGNVSIGTASNWDWSELDVNGGVNILPGQWDWGSGIALSAWDAKNGGGEQYLIGSTGALAHEGPGKFFIRNTDHYWDAIFIMDNQGRVGIHLGFDGLPQHTLDVGGDINFTGELLKNGVPFNTDWSEITNKPTTIVGYGITDAFDGDYIHLTNKPSGNKVGDIQYWNGTSWVILSAGTTGQVLTISSSGLPVWQDLSNPAAHKIGDTYEGGIIFYIDATGEHGLVCSPSAQSLSSEWGCSTNEISGADGVALGTGNANTVNIITGCTTAGIAARICYDLELSGYSDWYLPSKDELDLIYTNLKANNIGNFIGGQYWSSSETAAMTAWAKDFNNGTWFNDFYKGSKLAVLAIRSF